MISMPLSLEFRGPKKTRYGPRTDGPTDRPSYRDAWTHLKMTESSHKGFGSYLHLYGKNGFVLDGHPLDVDDIKLCQVYGDLTDMAILAEGQMSKKMARLSSVKNIYGGKNNINAMFMNSDGMEGTNNQYSHPINMMDQTQPEMKNQQIPPPPPPLPPSHPFPPPRQPEFENQGPRRPSYVSAEPGAVQVSFREYLRGRLRRNNYHLQLKIASFSSSSSFSSLLFLMKTRSWEG